MKRTKRIEKDDFDYVKAIKGIYNILVSADKSYTYQFGTWGRKSTFDVTARWTVATDLLIDWLTDNWDLDDNEAEKIRKI